MKREELYDVIAGLDEDIQERAYELEHTERKTVPFMKVFVLSRLRWRRYCWSRRFCSRCSPRK